MDNKNDKNHFFDPEMQSVWKHFVSHFRNQNSAASYQSDTIEFLEFTEKSFLETTASDVENYYAIQQKKIKEKELQPSTVAKKIRELNSLAAYIEENKEYYHIKDNYQNHFAAYLPHIEKMSKFAHSVPIEDIDKLLVAAQPNYMVYCIITLLYRMGLSSTEIVELMPEHFTIYDNGVYLRIPKRRETCFVPEDVYKIIEKYLSQRIENKYLFYNSRGAKLNTMYISRMMKKYTTLAGIPSYSAESLRNSCAYTMFAYDAKPEQVAREMGVTESQIRRYKNMNYMDTTSRAIRGLVKLKADPPE